MTQETRLWIANSKKLKKRYLSQALLDTDGKGQESSKKTMCHGIIYIYVEMIPSTYNKTPN